jgi:drug/metabolite transporter (DMT)-like permease
MDKHDGAAATAKRRPLRLLRQAAVAQRRMERLPATVRGLLWSVAAGALFVVLNAFLRGLTLELSAFQTQFLRYLVGLVVMTPFIMRSGLLAFRPNNFGGQFMRGGVHTAGLCLWFLAIPHITLADATAIGFTTPIFIMVGAALVLHEPMRWERWLAAAIGLAGVLLVVAPKLDGGGGWYILLMLLSAPVFAASFLLTKSLTRTDTAGVIVVWQSITVAIFSLPLAIAGWQWPTPLQWGIFALAGVLGSAGHYCLTRSFSVADISATQSVKFLDLVWATAVGWLLFADIPSQWTLAGGLVICGSTVWIARRESRMAVRG